MKPMGADVSSQQEVCRNDGTQLEEHKQDESSGQVGHVPQEEVLSYKGTQNTHNF